MRKFLLLAALCISSCPAEAAYAIDPDSCNPNSDGAFLEAQLQRAATLAKFISLNLSNNNGRKNPATNPEGWYYDAYVQDQVKLLMGGASDAYVISTETIFSYPFLYLRRESQILLGSECPESTFEAFYLIMNSRSLTP